MWYVKDYKGINIGFIEYYDVSYCPSCERTYGVKHQREETKRDNIRLTRDWNELLIHFTQKAELRAHKKHDVEPPLGTLTCARCSIKRTRS